MPITYFLVLHIYHDIVLLTFKLEPMVPMVTACRNAARQSVSNSPSPLLSPSLSLPSLLQGAQFHSLAKTVLADCYNEMLNLVAAQSDDGGFPVIMLLADTVPLEMLVCATCPPRCECLT